MFVKNFFGTSGIRGVIGKEIDEKFSYKIGLALGKYIKTGRALVAYDPRPGAKDISQAVVSGLSQAGIKVTDAAIMPTPELTWYQVNGGYDLGVCVTGSHLPWNMIGIIPTSADGAGIYGKTGEKITSFFNSISVEDNRAKWKGRTLPLSHMDYLQALLKTADVNLIKRRKFKILFDPVNGSAIEVGKKLFSQLGTVVMINDQLGQKPLRASEPRQWTLKETVKLVVKNHCDFGIATDVDADRVVFIDETGACLSEDLTAVILTEGKIAVTPVNSSGLFKKEMGKIGVKVIECSVGPPEIISAIKKYRADFAYEESGKYFFCRDWRWADGLLAGVKMLGAMARRGQKLSQIRQSYPVYHQVKLAVDCPWKKMPKKFIGDGVKLNFGDSWLFIRASGTEPLIRIFSDSPDKRRALQLAQQGKKIVMGAL